MQHFVCSLGKIPLRQLVYRVIELPPSMRPLVYDFGQLTNTTEQDYTGQIVINHCSEILSQQVVSAVSRVLAWCQKFMRERRVSYSAWAYINPVICEFYGLYRMSAVL